VTLVAIPGQPIYFGTTSLDGGWSAVTIDATGEYIAWILQAPKSGTIDRLHFNANTVTANGDGLRIRAETVDMTTGMPSGTLVGGSSEVTHATTAVGWNRHTGALGAAVSKGDFIALKLVSPSGTTFNGLIRRGHGGGNWPSLVAAFHNHYVVEATPTPTKNSGGYPRCIAIEYSDGTCPPLFYAVPDESASNTTFHVDSTPDEAGGLFTMPFKARVCALCGEFDQDGNYDCIIYDSANNVVVSQSVDKDTAVSTQHVGTYIPLTTPGTLEAGQQYRIVVKPTTTTAVGVYKRVLNTSIGGTRLREAYTGTGQNFKWTQRTDGGAWTDTDDSFADIGMLLDQLDDGAGGAATNDVITGVWPGAA
jgi:hypothetical protein